MIQHVVKGKDKGNSKCKSRGKGSTWGWWCGTKVHTGLLVVGSVRGLKDNIIGSSIDHRPN